MENTPQSKARDIIKRFLILFIPLVAISGVAAFFIYYMNVRNERALLEVQERDNVDFKTRIINDSVDSVASGLMYVSNMNALYEMPERRDMPESLILIWRKALANELRLFSSAMGIYEEIRYIDEKGMEAVKVESVGGKVRSAPDNELQSRAESDYFKGAWPLKKGEVYLSPFELKIENGRVIEPLRPIIRFATPVFDRRGRKRGIIVINYLGEKLLRELKSASLNASGSVMLLNPSGFYLYGPNSPDEWAFMYRDRNDRAFVHDYPDEWMRITGAESGQFSDKNGFFTFTTVYPLIEANKSAAKAAFAGGGRGGGGAGVAEGVAKDSDYYWKIVSLLPPGGLYKKSVYSVVSFRLYAGPVLLLAIISLYMSVQNARKKRAEEALKKKTSEIERANFELEGANSELNRSNQELEQFSYVASHDLQEPLRIVSGYTQLLARRYRGKFDASADEYIAYVVDGTKRMQTLISDLLTYSRVGKGKAFKPVDLTEAFNRAAGNLKLTIAETGATVEGSGLPAVRADPMQMFQLFQNLISNAIKYRSAAPPVIRVSAEKKGDEWVISVSDNGMGIDPKYFDRIFVIFQRLHGKGEYSGTGIGLSICKKIVENHGGRIWVESSPGSGSTFYFTVPDKSA